MVGATQVCGNLSHSTDGGPGGKVSPCSITGDRGERRQFSTNPFSCFLSSLSCLYFKKG